MSLFSVKVILLLCEDLNFSLLQITDAITSENLIQLDDPQIIQLLATQYDCPKQYNVRHFSLTVQKFT